jgi:glucuronosyltransferase
VTYHYPPDVLFAASNEVDQLFVEYIFGRTYGAEGRSVVGKMAADECSYMLSDDTFIDVMRSLDFDMALVEPFIVLPCGLLLPHRLGIRFVSMTHYYVPWTIRQAALPSFYPLYSTLVNESPIPDLRTFAGRLANAVAFYGAHVKMLPKLWGNDELLRRFAPRVGTWQELLSRSELFLMTVDHRLDSPLPVLPNAIPVAGVTARPAEPLTGRLRDVFEGSDNGVVIVSFGSIANHLPADVIRRFFDAFSLLNETIVAKFPAASREVATVPDNVELVAWLPQNDALGHRNTKLFVTHCGNNGQYEAVFHGVPMLGFPMFADQRWNCNRARNNGIGLCMDVVDFTSSQLYDNIRRLIDDPKFGRRAAAMSAAWRDEPLVGRWKAAFWIDHVLKHGGQHLRSSPAADMELHEFLMIDILVVGLVALVVVVGVAVFCVHRCGLAAARKLMRPKLKST